MVLRAINSRLPDHWAHRRPWRRLLDLWPQGQIASARLGLWPVGLLPQDRGTHCEPPLFQSANWSALKNKKRRSKYKQLIPMMRLPTSIDLHNIVLAEMSSCQGKCLWAGGRHQEAPTLSIHCHVRKETSLAPGLDIVPFPRCKLAQSSFSAWPQELQPFNKLLKVLRFGVTV